MAIPNECVVGCRYRDCTSETHSEFCPCAEKRAGERTDGDRVNIPAEMAVEVLAERCTGEGKAYTHWASDPFLTLLSVDNQEVKRITADGELVFWVYCSNACRCVPPHD